MKGILRSNKAKTGFMVELATKKGAAVFPIPELAKKFRDADAADGKEVDVERDAANRIVSVSIPGMAIVEPATSSSPTRKSQQGSSASAQHRSTQLVATKQLPKASPEILGEAFHNPYTFLPFGSGPNRERTPPSLLSIDELEPGRKSGVLVLSVRTLSPLISSHPEPESTGEDGKHKVYRGLCIGDDVVVPSTGIRGALRTLMTILTSGTLGYVDRDAYLTQGRDINLGPKTEKSPTSTPSNVFLGEVVSAGNALRDGTVRLGDTKLVSLQELERLFGRDRLAKLRDVKASPVWIQLDNSGRPVSFADRKTAETPWRLRLSGPVVGGRRIEERKKEALFRPGDDIISIPKELWAEYLGRNRFGIRTELKVNDLVWLEPRSQLGSSAITQTSDVVSLQWARWGKLGQRLRDKIPKQLLPDAWNPDGKVDEVTNLFGQVNEPSEHGKVAETISFAARLRPDNLVFTGMRSRLERVILAPLSAPHPGCLAFYRESADPDNVSYEDHALRGYKVYRNTQELDQDAPWSYETQGVYDDRRLKQPPQQNVNTTVHLIPKGSEGVVHISFRGLNEHELALLVQTCQLPWRLGGGKPLGLGRCQVQFQAVIDEAGVRHEDVDAWLKFDWRAMLSEPGRNGQSVATRAAVWIASQLPVPRLRYPRGIKGKSRGGHAWFGIHARPRAVSAPDQGKRETGLTSIKICGKMVDKARKRSDQLDPRTPLLSGQTLPIFDPTHPLNDLLYGYDMEGIDGSEPNIFDDFKRVE